MDRSVYMRFELSEEEMEKALENKSKSFWGVRSIDSAKRALFDEKVPLVTSMNWYKGYNSPKNGFLLKARDGKNPSGHAFAFKLLLVNFL